MDYGDIAVSRATRTGSLKLIGKTQSSPSVVIKSTTPMRIVSTPESYPSGATIDGSPNLLDTAANGGWVFVTKRREGNSAFDSPSKSCCERTNPLLRSVDTLSLSTPSTKGYVESQENVGRVSSTDIKGPHPNSSPPKRLPEKLKLCEEVVGLFVSKGATKEGEFV
ncbi:hypothetical protein AAC387_Pa04g1495 [Persea americana]